MVRSLQAVQVVEEPTGWWAGFHNVVAAVRHLAGRVNKTLTFPAAVAEPLPDAQRDIEAEFRDASNPVPSMRDAPMEDAPSLVRKQFSTAHKFYEAGNYPIVLVQLRDIPSHASDVDNYALRGKVHAKLGHLKEAAEDFTRTIERYAETGKKPDHETHYLLAEAQYETGDYSAASKSVNAAIKLLAADNEQDNAEYRLLATSCQYKEAFYLHEAGKSTEALERLSVIDTNNRDEFNYALRGEINYEIGNYPQAIEDLTKAIARSREAGKEGHRTHYLLAEAQYETGDYSAASKSVNTATKLLAADNGGDNAEYRLLATSYQYNEAFYLYKAGNFTEALERLSVIDTNNRDKSIYDLRAIIHYGLGHYAEAAEDFRKNADPIYANSLVHSDFWAGDYVDVVRGFWNILCESKDARNQAALTFLATIAVLLPLAAIAKKYLERRDVVNMPIDELIARGT